MRSGRVEVARLAGLYRGRELHGPATVTLRGAEIEIALGTERLGIPLHALHGLRLVGDALELYLDTGDVLTMHGVAGDLAPLAAALLDAGHAVPELTLPLRAFGTPRRGATTDHDRFFAPLLAARRRAEEQAAVDEKLRAFEAGALREAVSGTLAEFARARYPRSAAEQRALRAELEDCAGPLLARLDGVERAERRVREADDETRLVRWREWTDALRLLFQGADACWVALTPTLRRAAPARSRWRWFRLGALAGPLAGPLLGAAGLAAPAYAQHVQLRFTDISADSLRARHFDVVSAGRGFAIVVADTSDRARLAALGWRGEALTAPGTPGAPAAQRVATPRVYRSFDDRARGIAYFLDSLARTNPRVHLDTLGLSVEGRPILAAKVGASGDASSRPNVLFVATYHAREWAAPEMALRLLAYLARAPGSDLRADSLVARRDVWIVPVVNPDGYEYTFTTDRLWRKNRRPNADGTFGVDLNRNHAYVWALDNAGSSPAPAAETYRGRSAESEPETKAIANFSRAHPPVLSVSYHSFTGLVLYPWGYRFGRLANDLGIFRALAGTDIQPAVRDRLSGSPRDHYHPAPGWNLYPTNGEYTDWAYAEQRTLAFTVELTSGYEGRAYYGFEFPDDEPHLATMFADNLPFALDVLDAAVNPAMARPLATGLSVEPLAIESVSPVVRVRVPRDAAAGTHVVQPAALPLSADAAAGVAAYTQRLVSTPVARPARVVIEGAGRRV
ncbi:MAG: M14 family metallopeptidase, partial [Gemmatimonadaceae bacterium]